jgi:hypothetical protein
LNGVAGKCQPCAGVIGKGFGIARNQKRDHIQNEKRNKHSYIDVDEAHEVITAPELLLYLICNIAHYHCLN